MTRRDLVAERHGSTASSGAESFKSTDTVKNVFGSQRRRGTPVSIQTKEEERYVLFLELKSAHPALGLLARLAGLYAACRRSHRLGWSCLKDYSVIVLWIRLG